MDYYKDNYDDYQILWNIFDDKEATCSNCGGVFYRLGKWCICSNCGNKIHIDDFEDYVSGALY